MRVGCVIYGRTNRFTLVYIDNHTYVSSITSRGYACRHSTVHISYCTTGQTGTEVTSGSRAKLASSKPVEMVTCPVQTVQESSEDAQEPWRAAKNVFGEEPVGKAKVQIDEERLAQDLKEEKRRKARRSGDGRPGKQSRGFTSRTKSEEQLGKGLTSTIASVCVLTLFVEVCRMRPEA